MARIKADREVCVGSGMCVLTAPIVFDQSAEDGRVLVLTTLLDERSVGPAREAAMLCPSGALSVLEDEDAGPSSGSRA